MATRNDIADIFRRVDPEADYDNDEVFFGKILTDYEDYARLLEAEAKKPQEAAPPPESPAPPAPPSPSSPPPSDGLPHLTGGDIGHSTRPTSIFDIAALA